jgi:hypothetical protein
MDLLLELAWRDRYWDVSDVVRLYVLDHAAIGTLLYHHLGGC